MKAFILTVSTLVSFSAFAGYSKDLSLGSSIEAQGRVAIIARIDSEYFDFRSFPGLKTFLNQDFGYTSDQCVREAPEILLETKSFVPTGAGGGDAQFIFIQKVTCAWEFTDAKSYRIKVGFEGEGTNPKISSISPL